MKIEIKNATKADLFDISELLHLNGINNYVVPDGIVVSVDDIDDSYYIIASEGWVLNDT